MTKSKPTAKKSLPEKAVQAAKPVQAAKAVQKLCIVCHTSLPKQRRQSKSKFVDESRLPDNKEYHRACKTMAMTIYRCQALNMLKMSSQQRK